MRKKVFAAGLLCGLLFHSMAQHGIVYAASPTLSASADTGSVAAGEYVNINVVLGNNPSISTLGAALDYDSSVLKYDSSTWNSGFSDSDMQMASDTGSEVNLSVVCDDSYDADGTVVTVRFQAVADSSSIPVTLSLRDMADADLSAVADCTVASAVNAPKAPNGSNESNGSSNSNEPDHSDEPDDSNDPVDVDNSDDSSDISIVDEETDPSIRTDPSPDTGTDVAGRTNTSGAQSAGSTESGSTALASAQGAQPSSPDPNYQTGDGIGSDLLLIGAAASGILALLMAVRRRKEEK